MKSVRPKHSLSSILIPIAPGVLACPLVNYDYDKLSEYTLVKSMILATIFRWISREKSKKESALNWLP